MTAGQVIAPGHVLHRGWYNRQPGKRLTAESLIRTRPGWTQPKLRMFGRDVPVPRLVVAYGAAYSYSGVHHKDVPIPPELAPIVENASALYRNGSDSIGWHSDDEPELGPDPVIASLSIGGARAFRVRSKGRGQELEPSCVTTMLEDGDLLVMSGRSQLDYQHSVPRTSKDVMPRVNITLRRVQ